MKSKTTNPFTSPASLLGVAILLIFFVPYFLIIWRPSQIQQYCATLTEAGERYEEIEELSSLAEDNFALARACYDDWNKSVSASFPLSCFSAVIGLGLIAFFIHHVRKSNGSQSSSKPIKNDITQLAQNLQQLDELLKQEKISNDEYAQLRKNLIDRGT